jgi:hypothetical protein
MKKFKRSKPFENFLRASSRSTIELNEDQIDLISPDLDTDDILRAVEIAGWAVQKSELLQNGLIVFTLIDKRQMCSCGEPAQHYHLDEPCYGRKECCLIAVDYELEIACAVSRIREEMQKRRKGRLSEETASYPKNYCDSDYE